MRSAEELYATARLVNTALMAKIHTVDWTAAVLSHPTTGWGTEVEWWGLLRRAVIPSASDDARAGSCCTASRARPTKDFGVPFSITEEFVAVYRMHHMLPDEIRLYEAGGSASAQDVASRRPARPNGDSQS